ncbi:MAG: hypothetical protein K940chlam5_01264 [Candidatus Anoxychlamydiales bacterium]|nr:hypothetical protein [Candidatus Anoxychlamydiales bacterium]
MTIYKVINYGFSHLAQSLHEIKDIYYNGNVLYNHSDLGNMKMKTMTSNELCKLKIYESTMHSMLFIFRDYSFSIDQDFKARLISNTPNPPSLTSTFIKESLFRIAKGVAIVALNIFTLPIWAIILTGSYIYDRKTTSEAVTRGWKIEINQVYYGYSKIDLPPEHKKSHITSQDIIRIGKSLIGYRHVSTEEQAQENACRGVADGCSLNISFCPSESGEAIFENLDLKISSGKHCEDLIKKYEVAITEFIDNSIRMDIPSFPKTCKEFFSSLNTTRFMINKTRWSEAADTLSYGRLGRFPKEFIPSNNITLLRRIKREELDIPNHLDNKLIKTPYEYKLLVKYVASNYRKILLEYIRKDLIQDEFNCMLFRRAC